MRILLPLLLVSLLLLPVAEATFSIDVPSQKQQTFTKTQRQGAEAYVFQLQNPPFNLTNTNGDYANASLYTAKVQSKIYDPSPITTTLNYEIGLEFNDTHTYKTFFTYEKHGFGIFSYWNAYYSLQRDGEEMCNQEVRAIYGSDIRPNPSMLFDFSQRGSYNSIGDIALIPNGHEAGSANVSGEVIFNNPSLVISFNDDVKNKGTGRLGQTFGLECENGTTIGGAIFEDVFEITGAPVAHISTKDQRFYTHEIKYHFQNRTVSVSDSIAEVQGINEDRKACNFFFAGLCIEQLVAGAIAAIFDIALAPIDLLLSFISGGSIQLKAGLSYGFNTLWNVYQLFYAIIFLSGSNFPSGGIFIALLVWSTGLGFLLWSLSGNPFHVIGIPYWLIKGVFWSIVALTYGLWIWLPMKGFELITRIIQNVRG